MDQLSIHHEDVLMKMFVYSLDGHARKWYKTLPASSISSLKDFHHAFYSHYKITYQAERLYENCCEVYASYIRDSTGDSSNSADEGDRCSKYEDEDSFLDISPSRSFI